MNKKSAEPHFITNEHGKRVSVVLDIKVYQALVEKLEDMHDIARAEKIMKKTTKLYPLAEVEKKLRKQGKL